MSYYYRWLFSILIDPFVSLNTFSITAMKSDCLAQLLNEAAKRLAIQINFEVCRQEDPVKRYLCGDSCRGEFFVDIDQNSVYGLGNKQDEQCVPTSIGNCNCGVQIMSYHWFGKHHEVANLSLANRSPANLSLANLSLANRSLQIPPPQSPSSQPPSSQFLFHSA